MRAVATIRPAARQRRPPADRPELPAAARQRCSAFVSRIEDGRIAEITNADSLFLPDDLRRAPPLVATLRDVGA